MTATINQTLPFGDTGAAGTAAFYILQSETNTVRIDTFGQNGDDPTVVGDYDGDGKADVAVYRSGASAGDQSTWYYRGSLTPANVNSIPWGQNGDFPAPGDYDGDGKNDFVIQRASGGSGVFWMNTTSAGISTITFGNSRDVVVPGDYDGDGKTDLAVVRDSGGSFVWYFEIEFDRFGFAGKLGKFSNRYYDAGRL